MESIKVRLLKSYSLKKRSQKTKNILLIETLVKTAFIYSKKLNSLRTLPLKS